MTSVTESYNFFNKGVQRKTWKIWYVTFLLYFQEFYNEWTKMHPKIACAEVSFLWPKDLACSSFFRTSLILPIVGVDVIEFWEVWTSVFQTKITVQFL